MINYIVDIWYFPDLSLQKLATVPILGMLRNHIFFTKAIRIYIDTNTGPFRYYAYNGVDTANTYEITASMNIYEWNHILAVVDFDNISTFTMRLILNHDYFNPIELGSTTSDVSFDGVYFCHLDTANCNVNFGEIYWASGIYKDLKVWDKYLASPISAVNYHE